MRKVCIPVMLLFLFTLALQASPPATMSYQGFLTDTSGDPINDTLDLRFRIYTAPTGGTQLWFEQHNNVTVTNGVFNVILGASPDPQAYPLVNFTSLAGAFSAQFRKQLYLSIQVVGEASEMSPRHPLCSSPYALAARKVVYDNVITVSLDGGDVRSVSLAIDMLLGQGSFATALTPAPSVNTPWLIEVKAGVFTEPGTYGTSGTITVPDYVTIRGSGTRATILETGQVDMSGTMCALENLHIDGQYDSVVIINTTSGNYCSIRECYIESDSPTALIDLTGASYCVVKGNTLIGNGPMSCGGILMSGTQYTQVTENLINLANDAFFVSFTTGSFCITDGGTATVQCIISRNSLRYVTTGVAGPGPSYGIGLSGTSTTTNSSRVSFNTFQRGSIGKDIISVSTGNPPAWTAPGTGAHGICNQGSNGSQITSF